LQYLEEPLIQALREKQFENFKARDEELMRTLFRWMQKHMTLEMESSQYEGTTGGGNYDQ